MCVDGVYEEHGAHANVNTGAGGEASPFKTKEWNDKKQQNYIAIAMMGHECATNVLRYADWRMIAARRGGAEQSDYLRRRTLARLDRSMHCRAVYATMLASKNDTLIRARCGRRRESRTRVGAASLSRVGVAAADERMLRPVRAPSLYKYTARRADGDWGGTMRARKHRVELREENVYSPLLTDV